jgi:hypothetical protein
MAAVLAYVALVLSYLMANHSRVAPFQLAQQKVKKLKLLKA